MQINRGPEYSEAGSRGRLGTILLVVITALVTYTVTTFGQHQQWGQARELQRLSEAENFGRFLSVLRLIEEQYVDSVDLEQLIDGATSGMIESLGDPYSVYFDVEEYQEFEINLTGEYEGIGVVVTEKDGYVTVQTPFPGTPGATTYPEEASPDMPPGLMPGDKIIEIDDQNVIGVPVSEAAKLIRGPSGSSVSLSVLRPQESESDLRLRFVVQRTAIEIPTVQARMITQEIGYVWLSMFTKATPGDLAEAIQQLSDEGMQALILDLRNNPGGDLGASVEVASQFVPEGPIVHVERRGGDRETFMARGGALNKPLVVLVNGASASASEIVAGAIQDHGVGTLVGEETFGKGSVQTVWSLDDRGVTRSRTDGQTAGVKITTAKYLTPNERSIHGTGIKPDVTVEQPSSAQFGVPEDDLQLQRAIELLQEKLGA